MPLTTKEHLVRGVLLLAPLLAAPAGQSCFAPVHGIWPSPCRPGTVNCPGSDPFLQSEQLLVEAETTSVLSLNQWNQLEQCFAQQIPGTIPQQDCWISPMAGDPEEFHANCFCHFNIDPVITEWLDRFVVAPSDCSGGDERSVIIQLGPLFPITGDVRPDYLRRTPSGDKMRFGDPKVIQGFARLWDAVSLELASRSDSRIRPEWIISIGNEIDIYLDDPTGTIFPDGAYENSEEAWADYAEFYRKASRYVRGRRVDLDGDGTTDINTSDRSFHRTVTFTTTWAECTPGHRVVCNFLGGTCDCPSPPISFVEMSREADFWMFTRYPKFPGGLSPEATYGWAKDNMLSDLSDMQALSVVANLAGFTRTQRPIMLQESGFPSSLNHHADNVLGDHQAQFVSAVFDAWGEHNQQWVSLPEFWSDITAHLFEGPLARPRVLGLNWFMLHDFTGGGGKACAVPGDCVSGELCTNNVCTPEPNHCGFSEHPQAKYICSWGLIDQDGTPKPAWAQFVSSSKDVNPDTRDPVRVCE